jgi:hypothetical protein
MDPAANVRPEEVDITTLDSSLFAKSRNDLSFVVREKLFYLYEHQASVNPNIPVRDLLYAGRIFEKILDNKLIYATKPVKIPAPRFICLYNGPSKMPDYSELRLSDAFASPFDPGEEKALELVVKVYNIKPGHNKKILGRSPILNGCSTFIDNVRQRLDAGIALDYAIRDAVLHCVKMGILDDYLTKNGSEVNKHADRRV